LEQNCSEPILSEDYADFIIEFESNLEPTEQKETQMLYIQVVHGGTELLMYIILLIV